MNAWLLKQTMVLCGQGLESQSKVVKGAGGRARDGPLRGVGLHQLFHAHLIPAHNVGGGGRGGGVPV